MPNTAVSRPFKQVAPVEPSGRSESDWQAHIARWRQSGFGVSAYCRQHGLSRDAFVYRRRKFDAEKPGQPATSALSIVPIPCGPLHPPSATAAAPALRLIVAQRFLVEIAGDFSPAILEKLVASLERLA